MLHTRDARRYDPDRLNEAADLLDNLATALRKHANNGITIDPKDNTT